MCLHIDSLPNELLLVIFDLIPLSDLLQLDRVCPRWASLLPSALARRRTLYLILGLEFQLARMDFKIPFNDTFEVSSDGQQPYFDLPATEHDAFLHCILPSSIASLVGPGAAKLSNLARLYNSQLSGKMVTYFTDLLPNIDTLVVIHTQCYKEELQYLVELLGFWTLKILKLWLRTWVFDRNYQESPMHHPVCTLLHSIAQQTSLRHLTLDIDREMSYGEAVTFPIESYSFIAQLKVVKLYLGEYDRGNAIWNIVHRFDSRELRHISLGNRVNPQMDVALNPKFEFTTKVRQLYGTLSFETVEQLSEFCWRFPVLTVLRIDWKPNITFTQLVANCASLTQLTHLVLNIQQQHTEKTFALVDRVEGDDEEETRLISLSRVKILELSISNIRSQHYFESLSPLTFPSVEEVILLNDSFPSQNFTYRRIVNRRINHEVANRCHRLLILSLRDKFTNLAVRIYAKRVGLDSEFVDWSNYVRTENDDLPVVDDDDQS